MLGRKTSTPKIDEAVQQAVDYEVTVADVVRRSERRAWFVAGAASLLALLLAGGYYIALPLKERTPFLVMADPYAGTVTVAKLRSGLGTHSITANEAVTRSNLAHYVIARESYDIVQRDIRDWTIIYTMSSPEIASQYSSLYSRRNPNNLVARYGRSKAVRVQLSSINLLNETSPARNGGKRGGNAAVRFQRVLVNKQNGATSILGSLIANIRYEYDDSLALNEKQRMENPLGFRITSYRVDAEFGAPPVMPDGTLPAPNGLQTAVPVDDPGQVPQASALPATTPGQQPPSTPADPLTAPATTPNNANGVPNQ